MGGIGHKIIGVGVVDVADNHANWAYDEVAPEDEVVLEIHKIGVGDQLYQLLIGVGHGEAEGYEEGVDEIFV